MLSSYEDSWQFKELPNSLFAQLIYLCCYVEECGNLIIPFRVFEWDFSLCTTFALLLRGNISCPSVMLGIHRTTIVTAERLLIIIAIMSPLSSLPSFIDPIQDTHSLAL